MPGAMAGVIVAIDGPAASGKGTLARRLAAHFDFAFLDTGLLYRAAALHLAEAAGVAEDAAAAEAAARRVSEADAAHPPGGKAGAVLDGRDIGTVVCPGAEAKLFVTASQEERARRRVKELRERGVEAIYGAVLQDMQDRDARDSRRRTAPLRPADDAFVLDTTDLDADAAFAAARDYVSKRVKNVNPPVPKEDRG